MCLLGLGGHSNSWCCLGAPGHWGWGPRIPYVQASCLHPSPVQGSQLWQKHSLHSCYLSTRFGKMWLKSWQLSSAFQGWIKSDRAGSDFCSQPESVRRQSQNCLAVLVARGRLSRSLDLQADGYCLSSTVFWGLIGTFKMQIDSEPPLWEAGSTGQPDASIRMCRVSCWGAQCVSFIKRQLDSPHLRCASLRLSQQGFAELDGRAEACHRADVIRLWCHCCLLWQSTSRDSRAPVG